MRKSLHACLAGRLVAATSEWSSGTARKASRIVIDSPSQCVLGWRVLLNAGDWSNPAYSTQERNTGCSFVTRTPTLLQLKRGYMNRLISKVNCITAWLRDRVQATKSTEMVSSWMPEARGAPLRAASQPALRLPSGEESCE